MSVVTIFGNSLASGSVYFYPITSTSAFGYQLKSNITIANPDSNEWADCRDADGVISLGWHVHVTSPVDESNSTFAQCGAGATGGHYDPTYKCGGASQFAGTPGCEDVVYNCNSTNPSGCEEGDLSGKYGTYKITNGQGEIPLMTDTIGTPIDNLESKSVVFHCGSARVFCSTILSCADKSPDADSCDVSSNDDNSAGMTSVSLVAAGVCAMVNYLW